MNAAQAKYWLHPLFRAAIHADLFFSAVRYASIGAYSYCSLNICAKRGLAM